MADEHQEGAAPAARPTAARGDRDSVLAGLAKFRAGGSKLDELVDRDPHDGNQIDDTDDHGDDDEPERKPARRPAHRRDEEDDADEDDEEPADEDDEEDDDEEDAPSARRDEDEDDEDDEPADEDEDEDEDDAPPPAKRDPELERRAATLRKAETRHREMIARERAEIARERDQHRADLAEVAEFKALRSRAKYDPAGVLAKLGLGEDDYELAARQIYSRSKAASADPKTRAQADAEMRAREIEGKASKSEEEVAKIREELRQRDEREAAERHVAQYVTGLAEAVREVKSADLVRRAMKRNPNKTRAQLSEVALELAQRTGDLPSPKRAIRELERRKREALEEAGVDLTTVVKRKTTKPGDEPADKKTNGSNGKKPDGTAQAKPKDREAQKDDLLAEMRIARKKKLLA